MKQVVVKRVGGAILWDGVVIDTGGTISVPADIAESLLGEGFQSDGASVAPQWIKTASGRVTKAEEAN